MLPDVSENVMHTFKNPLDFHAIFPAAAAGVIKHLSTRWDIEQIYHPSSPM